MMATALEPLAPEDVVVVVHSRIVEDAHTAQRIPWLREVPRFVAVGGKASDDNDFVEEPRRRLNYINYDDNPGCGRRSPTCKRPTYHMIGLYRGAQRTVAGILAANDTWPDAKWVLVVDDDAVVDRREVWRHLATVDGRVPLLLAGLVGPHRLGRSKVKCRETSDARGWSCCKDLTRPCRANATGAQATWAYDRVTRTVRPKLCEPGPRGRFRAQCCRTKPWSAGAAHGYPWRLAADGPYRPHFAELWPYGGQGYALSRGLLDAIPRAYWETCSRALQCANADHRVMTCVVNAGFSLSWNGGIPGIRHHQNASGTTGSGVGRAFREDFYRKYPHKRPLHVRQAEERAAAKARWRERMGAPPGEPKPAASTSGKSAPLPAHPTYVGSQSLNTPLPPHQLGPPRKPRRIRLGAGDEVLGG